MWIATEHGCFSAVADRNEPRGPHLWVRSRSATDLERVRSAGYDLGRIVGMKNADYPYRVKVARTEWSRYVSDQIGTMDYDNFKSRVHKVDPPRADVYMGVWYEMQRIEENDFDRVGVDRVNERELAR